MGIDFSHCDAHWSYGGFHRFRIKLAAEVGIDLGSMAGFEGNKPWNNVKDDIVPLLKHSDCDGELSIDECKIVVPRLRQLVADWEDNSYDKVHALELAKGMEDAVKAARPLVFS